MLAEPKPAEAYILPFLLLSTLLRPIHPLLALCSLTYFRAMNGLFWLCNAFFPRRIILPPENELLLIPAKEAARLIRLGKLSSAELVKAYITRVREVNPLINAMVKENFEQALKKAQEVDRYIEALDKESSEYVEVSMGGF